MELKSKQKGKSLMVRLPEGAYDRLATIKRLLENAYGASFSFGDALSILYLEAGSNWKNADGTSWQEHLTKLIKERDRMQKLRELQKSR